MEVFCMSMKIFTKIDKFILVVALVLIALTSVIIYTLRTVFQSTIVAGQIDEKTGIELRIDKNTLDKVYESLDL